MTKRKTYNYKNCQSLFGYAYTVHLRSGGICQLCDAGGKEPSFDFWRQLTVEHLIGKKQGGYLKDIRTTVKKMLPELSASEQNELSLAIDSENTVTACSFCNSTTSRNVSCISMSDLLISALQFSHDPHKIVMHVKKETQKILLKKRIDVQWKIEAIRAQYDKKLVPSVSSPKIVYSVFEGGTVYTLERNGKYLVIIDESALADILEPDELDGIDLVKQFVFESEHHRSAYLRERFGTKKSNKPS